MTLTRRTLLASLMAGVALPRPGLANPASPAGTPFSPEALRAEAEALAARPYEARPSVPEAWVDLSYDEFRHIWFDERKAVWSDGERPLRLDLFLAGLYNPRPVEIALVEAGVATVLPFDIELFDRTDQFPDLPLEGMGYSGFRLRAELNRPDIFEEFMVFQGASYFRAIANGQIYGLSARGLAVGTGDPDGEEFPDFTRFYVEAPEPEAESFRVHALLDGPSVTGAYHFDIRPGTPTIVDVRSTIFPRRPLDNVGLAPLTSMFLFDETNRSRFDDFRPAVYDTDGLLMWNGAGERIWRPLANPRELQTSFFVDERPQGFGLMQRARDPEDFADLHARYEMRPSLWISPEGDWGPGSVQLVEIPSDREIYDNIVAYWRPRQPLEPGQGHEFGYRMEWGDRPVGLPDVARVINTRIGLGFDREKVVVAIDYEEHPALAGEIEDLAIHLASSSIPLSDGILERNPGTGGTRLAFSFVPDDGGPLELRAQLRREEQPVTEVWLYRWTA